MTSFRYRSNKPVMDPGFQIGHCLSLSAKIWQRNWIKILSVWVIFYSVPELIEYYAFKGAFGIDFSVYLETGFGLFLFSLPSDIIAYIGTGIITIIVMEQLKGKPLTLAELKYRMASSTITALFLYALIDITVLNLSEEVFLIPYLVFAVFCALTIPVIVEESHGGFNAIGRSCVLTKGYRWKISGVIAVVLMVLLAFLFLVLLILSFYIQEDIVIWLDGFEAPVDLLSPFFGSYLIVCMAVAYFEIRSVKEDMVNDRVLETFE